MTFRQQKCTTRTTKGIAVKSKKCETTDNSVNAHCGSGNGFISASASLIHAPIW